MTSFQFETCNGVGSPTRLFTLDETHLSWVQEGEQVRIALADLTEIRLVTYTAQAIPSIQCHVRATRGRNVLIRSLHFAGIGLFEDRSAACKLFLRQLIERTLASAPNVILMRGSTGLAIAWGILSACLIAMMGLLTFLMLDAAGSPNLSLLGALASLAGTTFFCLRQTVRNGAKPIKIENLKQLGI